MVSRTVGKEDPGRDGKVEDARKRKRDKGGGAKKRSLGRRERRIEVKREGGRRGGREGRRP
jgi:hypothetical protein